MKLKLKQHLYTHALSDKACSTCPACHRECRFAMESLMNVCINTKCKLFGTFITLRTLRDYGHDVPLTIINMEDYEQTKM